MSLDPKYSASATLTGLSGGTLVLDGISSTLAATLAPFYRGDDGAPGADGADGEGVPIGGTSGQVLAKASATDYDTEWVDQTGGGGSFPSPTIPAFTDVTDASLETVIESNAVVVSGDADAVWPAVVRGDGAPEMQVNAGSWGPSGIFRVGDSLKLRLTSSATGEVSSSANLYAQGVASPWIVTTTAGSPFDTLLATLLSGAAQVIAHPLEYGSMFQDRAGTTPVTEPGQLVGMVVDHGVTGSKPVAGPELVTNGTFDTDTSGWSVATGTATLSVIGGQLAIQADALDNPVVEQQISTVVGKAYRITANVSRNDASQMRVAVGSQSGQVANYFVYFVASETSIEFIFIATSATSYVSIRNLADNIGDTVFIDNISVRELPGYHATAISDAARGVFREVDGFRYIEYNGVNTAYATPALPAPLVDKAQVFAGVRKLGAAGTNNLLIELSPVVSNNGSFAVFAQMAQDEYWFASRGTSSSAVQINDSAYNSPITNVLTGIGDISGDLATLRIDGTQVAQSTADQGTGNYNPTGTYPLYYGARSGTSLFFNGRHYATLGPITRFSAANATAAQIEAAEAYYTARVI